VGIDAARRLEADHLRQEGFVALDQLARDAARLDDLLLVVDVVEEGVEGDDPLLDALGELAPVSAGNDAGDDVEGDELFGAVGVSVDREGNAGFSKEVLGVPRLGDQARPILCFVPLVIGLVGLPRTGARIHHFVKCQRRVPHFSSFEYNASGNARTMLHERSINFTPLWRGWRGLLQRAAASVGICLKRHRAAFP
jgi:hypothetical protein